GPASQRHCLGLFSRFLSWCIVEKHATRNVVHDVPASCRPRVVRPRPDSIPWLESDDQVLAIMNALPSPFREMFYLGSRCGARLGETLGLRLGDLDELETTGETRLAHSHDGPLKEDRHGDGKEKRVQVPAETAGLLAPILAQRRAAGAG